MHSCTHHKCMASTGDVAHMAERSLRMREVQGSIPCISRFCSFYTLHKPIHTRPVTPNPTLTPIFHLLASWRAASAHYHRIRWAQGLPTTRYTPPSTERGVRRGGALVSRPSAKHPHHDMSTRHVRRGPPSLWAAVPSLLGVRSGLFSLRTTPHPSAHGFMTCRRDTYGESY
jgi:hypothetical protein